MNTLAKTISGKYLDSVKLMLISKELRSLKGVEDAVAITATKENKEILAATGMLVPDAEAASETEIVIVIKAADEETAKAAMQKATSLVENPPAPVSGIISSEVRNLAKAIEILPEANLCLISVAGKYAAAEAEKALDKGLHVMLFSDNVSLEDELALKHKALKKGLLMMGPDCGTAIINGLPLAFANNVPTGNIGIVSASGTGLQDITCGIANRGCGITQAFGTGGRDGKKEIGGIMLKACLQYLMDDTDTEVIVLMGKTPAPEVLNELMRLIKQTHKPVIVNFLKQIELPELPNLQSSVSLAETAELACQACKKPYTEIDSPVYKIPTLPQNRKYIRGLYSGGTLCQEAILIYKRLFGAEPFSNVGAKLLAEGWHTQEDSYIDMGSDEFTVGRPHPMIDYSLRLKKLSEEAADKQVGVILLDVVLGYGAHPDPASELVPVLQKFPGEICIVCHVLGTDADPQDRQKQIAALRECGVYAFTSHANAVDFSLKTLMKNRENV